MGTRSIFWAALVACVPIAGLFAGDEPAKPGVAAEQLVGEWKQLVTLQKKDDTLMVITFRRNGVCRIDALDRNSGEPPLGPDVRPPSVGPGSATVKNSSSPGKPGVRRRSGPLRTSTDTRSIRRPRRNWYGG